MVIHMNTTQTLAPRGYRHGIVCLGTEETLPAFLPEDGRTWNGFDLPIFDPAVIAENRATLDAMFPVEEDNPDALVLTWDGDRPSIIDPQYVDEDPEYAEYVKPFEIDGQALLSIGDGCFIWSEVDE